MKKELNLTEEKPNSIDIPIISVIVPVYNVSDYLKECIDSLINQSRKDIEIILIDDGSTDDSLIICKSYLEVDSRIRVFETEHKGAGAVRNFGIDHARGKYIMFVDSDDYVDLNYVNYMYNTVKDSMSILPVCNSEEFEPYGSWIRYPYKGKKYSLKEIFEDWDNTYSYRTVWNKIYSRKIIQKNGIRFPENIHYGEDTVFVLKYLLCLENDCTVLIGSETPYYHYRKRRNGNLSTIHSMDDEDIFRELFIEQFLLLKAKLNLDDKKIGKNLNSFCIDFYYRHLDILRALKGCSVIKRHALMNRFIKNNISYRERAHNWFFRDVVYSPNPLLGLGTYYAYKTARKIKNILRSIIAKAYLRKNR